MSTTPELLYHTTLTVVNYSADASGSVQTVYVLATHTTLVAAKRFAADALHSLGYEPDDFALFEGHQPGRHWRHGNGVVVYAKSPGGQELLVALATTPNAQGLAARNDGTLDLPHGASDHLHYVLQTRVDYNRDRSGAIQTTEIEGAFLRREDALRAAHECLARDVGPRNEFAQYDERPDLGQAEDWPFGEDVLVHAVAVTGENYTVAVRTPPDAHKQHGKHENKNHHHYQKTATKAKLAAAETSVSAVA